MVIDWRWIDWTIVSALASAIATVLAVIGIGLAWRATAISRQSTEIDRRGYLDNILDNLITRVDELEAATQRFWSHTPTDPEIAALRLQLQHTSQKDFSLKPSDEAAQQLHESYLRGATAIGRLASTGLLEMDRRNRESLTLEQTLALLQAAHWLEYSFASRYSRAEAEALVHRVTSEADNWNDSWRAVRAGLIAEQNFKPDGPEIKEAYRWAADMYPTSQPASRRQLADAVLRRSKGALRARYRLVVTQSASWHPDERKHAQRALRAGAVRKSWRARFKEIQPRLLRKRAPFRP